LRSFLSFGRLTILSKVEGLAENYTYTSVALLPHTTAGSAMRYSSSKSEISKAQLAGAQGPLKIYYYEFTNRKLIMDFGIAHP
jgi:hypothetical protein